MDFRIANSVLSEYSVPLSHSGPFKPSLQFDDQPPNHALVFFAGSRHIGDSGPFPFAFTLGCLKVELPEHA